MSKDKTIRPAQGNDPARAAVETGAVKAPGKAPEAGETQVAKAPTGRAAAGNSTAAVDATVKGREQQQQMLQFVEGRLANVSSVQQREIAETHRRPERDWWYQVADSQKQARGTTKPEPTEWHRVAEAYREAAAAIARGDLARGGALLRHAFEEDRKAFAKLTHLVHAGESERPRENPWHQKVQGFACGSVHVPKGISSLSDAIITAYDAVKDPPVRAEERKVVPIPGEEAEDKGKAKTEDQKKLAAVKPEVVEEKKPEAEKEEKAAVAMVAAEPEKAEAKPKAELAPTGEIAAGDKAPAAKGGRTDRLAAAAKKAEEAKKAAANQGDGSAAVEVAKEPIRPPEGAAKAEAAKAPEAPDVAKAEEASKKAKEEEEKTRPAFVQAAQEDTKRGAASSKKRA